MSLRWTTLITAVLLALILLSGEVDASHFRGGIITWRPLSQPTQPNSLPMIEISYRVAWRRSSSGHACAVVGQLLSGEGSMSCSCSGLSFPLSYYCTDYSVLEDWTSGLNTYVYQPTLTTFDIWFNSCCWITSLAIGGGSDWDLGAKIDLSVRSDGRINSSPVSSITPIVRFPRGCNNTIRIPVFDADGDVVRCYWATWRCGGICGSLPGSNLDHDACLITWEANSSSADGLYGVAIEIGDFMSGNSSYNLSTISVQFIVDLYTPDSCSSQPVFVYPTPLPDSCLGIPDNSTYQQAIVAHASDPTINIIAVDTVSPPGLTSSSVYPPNGNSTDYYIVVTWTPFTDGVQEIFCFTAMDSQGSSSEQSCISLVTGTPPPAIVSTHPRNGGTLQQNNAVATVTFDQEITAPPRPTMISIYHIDGTFVAHIDSSRYDEVQFHDRSMTFDVPVGMLEVDTTYYVLMEPGVARSTHFCGVESLEITNASYWMLSLGYGGLVELTNIEPSTTLTSPDYPFDYPHHVDRTWIVTSVPGTVIEVTFNQPFIIEHHPGCAHDYVEIRNGSTVNDTLLGVFCGSIIPAPISSTSNVMLIRFVSDSSVSHVGFSLNVSTVYGGDIVLSQSDPSAVIISPGYPMGYPQNIDCMWTVVSPTGTTIMATFEGVFQVDPHPSCSVDFVEVRDGLLVTDVSLGTSCGWSAPSPLMSTSNGLFLRFSTSGNTSYAGFSLNVSYERSEQIVLRCDATSFQVDIPRSLAVRTFQAVDLYLYGNESCRGVTNGPYISLNSSLTGCGTEYLSNHSYSFYRNTVLSRENNTSIVQYLGLQIPIICQYNRSRTMTSHFMTMNDFMVLKEEGEFVYDFAIYSDISYTVREETYPVKTHLGTSLFFRAELVRSASNLDVHLRSCRATPSPAYDDSVVYEFIEDGCGVNDASVRILTPEDPRQADFELSTFRFTHVAGNVASQVWVHCEVVSCDVDDVTSECGHGCEEPRYRRSARREAATKAKRVVRGPILIEDGTEVDAQESQMGRGDSPVSSWNILTSALSMVSLMATVGMLVMAVLLGRAIHQHNRHPAYQPVPRTTDA